MMKKIFTFFVLILCLTVFGKENVATWHLGNKGNFDFNYTYVALTLNKNTIADNLSLFNPELSSLQTEIFTPASEKPGLFRVDQKIFSEDRIELIFLALTERTITKDGDFALYLNAWNPTKADITPLPLTPTELTVCKPDNISGKYIFNLRQAEASLSTIPSVVFTYYLTREDAELGGEINKILNPTNYAPSKSGAVYVRGEVANFSAGITEIYLYRGFKINEIGTHLICALDFRLKDIDSRFTTNPSHSVTYYRTEEDAAKKINVENKNTDVSSRFPYPYFARIDDAGGCYALVEFRLKVTIGSMGELLYSQENCDLDGEGAIADLTGLERFAEEGFHYPENASYTYYETYDQADAAGVAGRISNPKTYLYTTNKKVYARVTVEGIVCETKIISTINLTLAEIKSENFETNICATDSSTETKVILSEYLNEMIEPTEITKLDISFHISNADGQSGANAIPNPSSAITLTSEQTIFYVRFKKSAGCYRVNTLTFNKTEAPLANDVSYKICYEGNYEINLAETLNALVNLGTSTITYYSNRADALSGDSSLALPNLHTIVNISAKLYARVEVGQCFNVSEITFVERPSLVLNPVELKSCLFDDSGNTVYDLEKAELDLGVTAATYTYYETEAEAKLGGETGKILTPNNYIISLDKEVYVRVETADTCPTVGKIHLFSSLEIVSNDYSEDLCALDGTMSVVLDDYISKIITSSTALTISFHTTQADAESGNNPLLSNVSMDLTQTTTFYVRFVNSTDCFKENNLTLSKTEVPEAKDIVYELCTIEGVYSLDLSVLDELISLPGSTVSYFSNKSAAWSNDLSFSLPKGSAHILSDINEVVYARVGADGECPNVSEVRFIANPLVELNPAKLTSCDGNVGRNTLFDLTQAISQLVVSPSSGISFTYYLTEADAILGGVFGRIDNPTVYEIATNQTVYARGEAEGYCASVERIDLLVSAKIVTKNHMEALCQTSGEGGITEIVLEDYLPMMIDESAIADLNISYYATTYDAQNNLNALSGHLPIVLNPKQKVYYVRFEDKLTGCYVIREIQFNFNSQPRIIDLETTMNSIKVTAVGDRPILYSLDNEYWRTSNVFNALPPGIYTIYIKNGDTGCEGIPVETVLLDVLNTITPNGDGINDAWKLCGLEHFKGEVYIQIFDRYGKKVFEEKSQDCIVWDGKQNGRTLPTTSYWYIIDFPDGKSLKGHILIKNR